MTYNTNNKRSFPQLSIVWNNINEEEINKQADEW
jgi:hypothetical protein